MGWELPSEPSPLRRLACERAVHTPPLGAAPAPEAANQAVRPVNRLQLSPGRGALRDCDLRPSLRKGQVLRALGLQWVSRSLPTEPITSNHSHQDHSCPSEGPPLPARSWHGAGTHSASTMEPGGRLRDESCPKAGSILMPCSPVPPVTPPPDQPKTRGKAWHTGRGQTGPTVLRSRD